MSNQVNIYTDGACSGNPGPGGWGAVLEYGGHRRELSGGEPQTTNNRMELTAVIEALSALKRPCKVVLTTDSKYIVDAVTLGWAKKWRSQGWMRNKKEKASNTINAIVETLQKNHFDSFEACGGFPPQEAAEADLVRTS